MEGLAKDVKKGACWEATQRFLVRLFYVFLCNFYFDRESFLNSVLSLAFDLEPGNVNSFVSSFVL